MAIAEALQAKVDVGWSMPADQSHIVMNVRSFMWFKNPSRGATRETLVRRAHFGGRKGNSARRRLHFKPSTSAQAFRATQALNALQGEQ